VTSSSLCFLICTKYGRFQIEGLRSGVGFGHKTQLLVKMSELGLYKRAFGRCFLVNTRQSVQIADKSQPVLSVLCVTWPPPKPEPKLRLRLGLRLWSYFSSSFSPFKNDTGI